MAQSVVLTDNSSGSVGPGTTPEPAMDRDDPAPRGETRLLLLVGPRVPRARGIDLRLTAPAAGVAAPGRGRFCFSCLASPPLAIRPARGLRPVAVRFRGSAARQSGRGTCRR